MAKNLTKSNSLKMILDVQLKAKYRYLTEFFTEYYSYERGFYQSPSQVIAGCKCL